MTAPAGGRSPTLAGRVAAAADGSGAVTFVSEPGAPRVPWADLHADARSMAARLRTRGVEPGDVVALLGTTSPLLVTAVQAVWLAGATVNVVPLPHRVRSLGDVVAQTRDRIRSAGAAVVVADRGLAAFAEPQAGDPPMVLLPDLATGPAPPFEERPDDPTALAVLQFTSGATGDPKGVCLPHTPVLANLDAAASAAALEPGDDVLVSWLPLYHDMGLLGLLTLAMVTGTDLVLGSPQEFAATPGRWLRWMSDFGGTATAGPDFAYAMATRAMTDGGTGPLDLSRCRITLLGGDCVDPATVEAFLAAGAPSGLRPGAAFPAFGMAELGVAGTFPEPGRGLAVDWVDGAALAQESVALPVEPGRPGSRRLARLGRPVPGLEMRACDPGAGTVLDERAVGELELRGTSMMAGYAGPVAPTEEVFHDGWLRTGDLAYVAGGELVVCGRLADVIVAGGLRLFPADVERAAATVDGVRPGNVAAFADEGPDGPGVVVVAEVRSGAGDDVRRRVTERVAQAVGAAPIEVVLVAPGTLAKTSSGKLRRGACRASHAGRRLEPAP